MLTSSMLLHSKTNPLGFTLSCNSINVTSTERLSLRHCNERFKSNVSNTNIHYPLKITPPLLKPTNTNFSSTFKCTNSTFTASESSKDFSSIKPLKNLSFDKVKATLLDLTPIEIIKWCGLSSIVIAATKWTVNLVINPFFWMYFSWSWLFWPWFVAISLGVYGLYCFYKHSLGEASIFEQLAVVTSVFTWLTLVPPAHFNGYLEGWPFVFFLVYHYFFFFNVSVRKRLYGDYFARPHDPKWDVNPPKWYRLLFCIGVMAAHWLAAFEGPELHLVPGGWNNLGIWILIVATLLMQYNSTLYLAKYSEKIVVPTAVVQFGPFRWVRHPIYSSTMLLCATYFVALGAPLSLLLLVVVCLTYYDQKAKMEEALMIETFGERYIEYMDKVRYKFIPYVY